MPSGVYIRTDEARRNIAKAASISSKGRWHTDESKAKLRKAHLGKKLSDETKLSLSKANLGKKLSEATKLKMSAENNHNWVGNNISYNGLHGRVVREKGPAKNHSCEFADETCKGIMEWSNISNE